MAIFEQRKNLITKLLKGIETGDPEAVAVVDEEEYIQHNPQTHEGSEGLATLFARLAKSHPRVNVVRAFGDGDVVFAYAEYDFLSRISFASPTINWSSMGTPWKPLSRSPNGRIKTGNFEFAVSVGVWGHKDMEEGRFQWLFWIRHLR